MPELIDLTGMRFGSLTVLAEVGWDLTGHILWLCRCDCGRTRTVYEGKLKAGEATSCGCGAHRASAAAATRGDDAYVAASVSGGEYSNNTSGKRGVSFDRASGKWFASISAHGKRRFLGRFARFEDAVAARVEAERALAEEARDDGRPC